MKQFFPMPTGDILFVAGLTIFSVVSFLPWSQETGWLGMAWLGWMMAILMIVAPTIALLRLIWTGARNDD